MSTVLESGARRRRFVRRAAWIAGLLLAGWIASSFLAAYVLTHRRGAAEPETRPALQGLTVEDAHFVTTDGEHIGAWLFQRDAPKSSVVIVHGWHASRTSLNGLAEELARRGYGVLSVSLRSHGDSSGSVYDFGLDARRDVIGAVTELERLRPRKPIFIVGFSYGAASAAFAAEELGPRVTGYVFDSMLGDARSAIRNRCAMYLPPVLDDMASSGLLMASQFMMPRIDEIDSARACEKIPRTIPVLLARCTLDRHVVAAETERLRAALAGHVEYVEWPGAEHDRGYGRDPERWLAAFDAFASKAVQ